MNVIRRHRQKGEDSEVSQCMGDGVRRVDEIKLAERVGFGLSPCAETS